jgi:putative acetyltransferase
VKIRPERPADRDAIAALIEAAFAGAPHSSGTEARIVAALRDAGALTLSLVAEDAGAVIGQVAFSPVTIDGADMGWFGLGPVAVTPDRQGQGIGGQLIEAGLAELRARNAAGCVLLGEPDYYRRFGFRVDPVLRLPGVPPGYFQALPLAGPMASGTVAYHPVFGVT